MAIKIIHTMNTLRKKCGWEMVKQVSTHMYFALSSRDVPKEGIICFNKEQSMYFSEIWKYTDYFCSPIWPVKLMGKIKAIHMKTFKHYPCFSRQWEAGKCFEC